MGRPDEAFTALGGVVDPELDEPITDLGFVRSLHVDGDAVVVHLRLPTSFCAPNFAFGHEAEESLEELRATFRRKAHTAAMERCLTGLLRAGRRPEDLGTLTLADLPPDAATAALHRRREALGLPGDDGALVLVDATGRSYPPEEVPLALRRARSTRISIDGNAHFCRGLLATRYPGADADQAARPAETFIPLTTLQGSAR
jgi:metal-sulfur cluster biosynthetic enzyme